MPRAKPTDRQPPSEIFRVKEAVRDRDGRRCTECGIPEADYKAATGRRLDVHRLRAGSRYTLEGSVAVCAFCHDRTVRRRGTDDEAHGPVFKGRFPVTLIEAFVALAAARGNSGWKAELRNAADLYLRRMYLAIKANPGSPFLDANAVGPFLEAAEAYYRDMGRPPPSS